MKKRALVLGIAAVLAVGPGLAAAQAPAGAAVVAGGPAWEFREFDVVSIKEDRSGAPGHTNNLPGGTYEASLPLTGFIFFAYNLSVYQIAALNAQAPEWAKTVLYEMVAKVEGNPTMDDKRRMMRALLAERFKLKIHTETRDSAVMQVELVKPGKVGPALTAHPAADPKCEQGAKPVAGFFSPCGMVGVGAPWVPGHMKVAGRNVSIAQIANYLPGRQGMPAVDKTGLTGTFDFTLDYVPDPPPGAAPAAPADTGGATGWEAMTEQLGLKLVPGRAPVEVYVLDAAERPEAN